MHTLYMSCKEQGHTLWVTARNKWPQLLLFVLTPYSHYGALWGCDWAHDKCTSLYVCEELLSDMNRREWKKCSFLFSTENIAFLRLQRCMCSRAEPPGKLYLNNTNRKIIWLNGRLYCEISSSSEKDSWMLFVKRLKSRR